MRVLHLSGATSWGGNEQQLVDSIPDLERIGVYNIIYCFKDSPLEAYAINHDLNYKSVDISKLYSYNYARKLSKYIRKQKIDIVHLHTSNSVTGYVISDLLFRLKTPAVFSKKGISKKRLGLSVYKYNYKNIKKVICVSGAVKESFKDIIKKKNHDKMVVVYDGIRVERQKNKSDLVLREVYNIPKDKVLIGNIANHTRAKDLVSLVETINILVNQLGVTNIHVVQIGKDGSYSNEFLPLIDKYNLRGYITVTGFLDNAIDLLKQFDIYLMTSEREGLPITIYEAFLKQVPVVTTRAGGIPEAITHKVNGLLSDVKDTKNIADNLKFLINNKELQKQFVKVSYELLFERFTTKELSKSMLKVYDQSLK